MEEFKARGVKVVTLSVDPPETSAAWAETKGFEFTLLSDPEYLNIRRWGLENPDVGELALHAAYVIEQDGTISYAKIARRRVKPDELLMAVDRRPVLCCAGSCGEGPVCQDEEGQPAQAD